MNVLLNTLVPEDSYENYRDDEYSDAIYAEMTRATEELNFMDSFLKVSEINATNKLKMVKSFNPLNQVYRLNQSFYLLMSLLVVLCFNPLNQVYRLNTD